MADHWERYGVDADNDLDLLTKSTRYSDNPLAEGCRETALNPFFFPNSPGGVGFPNQRNTDQSAAPPPASPDEGPYSAASITIFCSLLLVFSPIHYRGPRVSFPTPLL